MHLVKALINCVQEDFIGDIRNLSPNEIFAIKSRDVNKIKSHVDAFEYLGDVPIDKISTFGDQLIIEMQADIAAMRTQLATLWANYLSGGGTPSEAMWDDGVTTWDNGLTTWAA